MISMTLMKVLVVEYIVLAIMAIIEGSIPLTFYWLGASLLTLGVIFMKG